MKKRIVGAVLGMVVVACIFSVGYFAGNSKKQ